MYYADVSGLDFCIKSSFIWTFRKTLTLPFFKCQLFVQLV